jgi:hypothetical protein
VASAERASFDSLGRSPVQSSQVELGIFLAPAMFKRSHFTIEQIEDITMPTTVTEIFDCLVEEIKNAVADRGFLSVCNRAMELGLSGGPSDSEFSVGYRFEGSDSTGDMLSLYVRSYDPSGPMQVRPRLTRFTIAVSENCVVKLEYEDEYEGSNRWRREVLKNARDRHDNGSEARKLV